MKEDTSMTTNELRAAAEELLHLHERFAPLFGRKEAQLQSFIYLHGLLLAPGRKSAEPMALIFGEPEREGISQNQVLALQRFLTYSPWDFRGIHREIQAVFAEELVPSTAAWSIGTVGVIDESGFVKQGKHSVGVQRQCETRFPRRTGPCHADLAPWRLSRDRHRAVRCADFVPSHRGGLRGAGSGVRAGRGRPGARVCVATLSGRTRSARLRPGPRAGRGRAPARSAGGGSAPAPRPRTSGRALVRRGR